jgi:hypothetical protein
MGPHDRTRRRRVGRVQPVRTGLGRPDPPVAAVSGVPSPAPARIPDKPPRARRRGALRRGLAAVVATLLGLGAWSAVGTLTYPGTAPLAVKWVEWVRDHGGSSIVRFAEQEWYSHHPPPSGGRPAPGLIAPRATTTTVAVPPTPHLPPPPPVPPIVTPALPGEGVWQPAGRLVDGVPAVYTTRLRPDPGHPSVVAALAFMDPTLLRARLFAGAEDPGGTGWQDASPIPLSLRPSLVVAFNSGFRLSGSEGGYYADGRVARPLVDGAASFVVFKNGRATVGVWGRDVQMGPDVEAVRQNLSLIVDHGQPVPGLSSGAIDKWGATLGNQLYVWRSGIGVTEDGGLLYAAGPYLSAATLAGLLAQAGAVRAMELDINTDWVNCFVFDQPPGQPASPANGTKLLPGMVRPTSRYFGVTARDFIAMFARTRPLEG